MSLTLLDMVWPAIYVSETLSRFSFLIVGTIIIELFVIRYLLKFSWKRSFFVSLIGNCVSGFVGTFVMMIAMLFWHVVSDSFFLHATFHIINWIATYILMCMGSVFLETLAIKLFFQEKIKKLFLPMLTGNFLSYAFIAFVMITGQGKDPDEEYSIAVKYLPSQQDFILLDNTKFHIDTAIIRVSFDKHNNILNEIKYYDYNLLVPFKKQPDNDYNVILDVADNTLGSPMGDSSKRFIFSKLKNEYIMILQQKNPDTALGWKKPVFTDTILLKRIRE